MTSHYEFAHDRLHNTLKKNTYILMKNKLLLTLFGLSILTLSCKKNLIEDGGGNQDLNALEVPANFNWQTARDVKFTIGIHDVRFQNGLLHVIEVFIGDPANGGKPIAKGAVSLTSAFKFKTEIPATVNEVYVTKTAPDGSKFSQKVTLTGTDISLSIGSTNISQSIAAANQSNLLKQTVMNTVIPTQISPDCSSCDAEFNATAPKNLNGKTYCITKPGTITNVGTLSNGTLKICATGVTLQDINMGEQLNIIVTNTGSATFTNLNTWTKGSTISNFGTANFGNLTVNGPFYNSGKVSTAVLTIESATITNNGGDFSANNLKINGAFYNTGTLKFADFNFESGTFNNSGNVEAGANTIIKGTFINTGTYSTNGVLTMTGLNANVGNTGTLTVKTNLSLEGNFDNAGKVTVNGGDILTNPNFVSFTNRSNGEIDAVNARFTINKGTVMNYGKISLKYFTNKLSAEFTNNCKLLVSQDFINEGVSTNNSYIEVGNKSEIKNKLTLNNAALFQTNTLGIMTSQVIGLGTTSFFKVLVGTNPFSGTFEGNLKYCDPKTHDASRFIPASIQTCVGTFSIPDCKGESTEAPIADRDGDKVADAIDNYPDDPKRAFNNYSLNYDDGGSTVAFEDSWPKRGDYDLNDVVISSRYHVVTSATNKIVDIKADYKLLASGGIIHNGAGVQFNIPSAKATKFSGTNGAKLESGQDSIVVILFSNSRSFKNNWNTKPGEAVTAPIEFSVSFEVIDGPDHETFGISNYNPFIWNDWEGRAHETHLKGKHPTKLGTRSLFGTQDDATLGTDFYRTKTGLPWAIMIPAKFEYPVEETAITATYLKFADWAASGGTRNRRLVQ